MARTGGHYACVEALDESWRTRKLIRTTEVMAYEALGEDVQLGSGSSRYQRNSNPVLFASCCRWRDEVQRLLNAGLLKHHPLREISGRWDGILQGMALLKSGQVRGEKLVVRVASTTSSSQ